MDIKQLIDVLLELRSASMKMSSLSSEDEIKAVMHRYDMLFVGEKFNLIYSADLCHALKNYFHLNTDKIELNNLIPTACKSLSMKFEPLIEVSKIGKSIEPDQYKIILW